MLLDGFPLTFMSVQTLALSLTFTLFCYLQVRCPDFFFTTPAPKPVSVLWSLYGCYCICLFSPGRQDPSSPTWQVKISFAWITWSISTCNCYLFPGTLILLGLLVDSLEHLLDLSWEVEGHEVLLMLVQSKCLRKQVLLHNIVSSLSSAMYVTITLCCFRCADWHCWWHKHWC